MDSKAIIAIAVVAILVVAGACVYVFVLNKDKDSSDHYETLRDIAVGDEIELGMDMKIVTHTTGEGDGEEFLDDMYFSALAEPIDEKTVTFQGKDYDCYVYQTAMGDEGMDAYISVVKTSGVILYAEPVDGDGYLKLAASDFDVAKQIDEHDFAVGSSYQYDIKIMRTYGGYTAIFTGTLINTVTEVLDGGLEYTSHEDMSAVAPYTMKLASIDAGVYKFEGMDAEYTKAGAMQFYSFSEAYENLVEQYGNAIVPGEKKTSTMDTAYGERQITLQKYTIDDPLEIEDSEIAYSFYYGKADVLYECHYLTTMGDEDDSVVMHFKFKLKDCDAVTTV